MIGTMPLILNIVIFTHVGTIHNSKRMIEICFGIHNSEGMIDTLPRMNNYSLLFTLTYLCISTIHNSEGIIGTSPWVLNIVIFTLMWVPFITVKKWLSQCCRIHNSEGMIATLQEIFIALHSHMSTIHNSEEMIKKMLWNT